MNTGPALLIGEIGAARSGRILWYIHRVAERTGYDTVALHNINTYQIIPRLVVLMYRILLAIGRCSVSETPVPVIRTDIGCYLAKKLYLSRKHIYCTISKADITIGRLPNSNYNTSSI
ncbi:MAG: hypothetical protein BWY70_00434 [Bacteroidetes bacterium ADurb.Bin408]|nr:MAG: hypothetical protein BWY70_00434 [Bacteroidetes bacterium ADurb.Bin408]